LSDPAEYLHFGPSSGTDVHDPSLPVNSWRARRNRHLVHAVRERLNLDFFPLRTKQANDKEHRCSSISVACSVRKKRLPAAAHFWRRGETDWASSQTSFMLIDCYCCVRLQEHRLPDQPDETLLFLRHCQRTSIGKNVLFFFLF